MSLFDTITALFRRVPLDRKTVGTALGQPPALSHTLTVDRLAGILRQAEAGECQELFAVYRDIRLGHSHTQAIMNQRKLAVLTKTLTIVPEDPALPEDVLAAKKCRLLLRSRGWQGTAMAHLLNGHTYPVAVLEQVYRNAPPNADGFRYLPAQWVPVPYHLLDWSDGCLKIWDADPVYGQRLGTKSEPQELRHIIHRGHLLTDIPDNWGGPMRAALFWWLFATMDRDWWVRFLDRFGAPFIVGRYDSADTGSKAVLTRAFSAATRLFGLVVTKETDIQVHAIATSSHGEAFEKLQVFANGELSKLFLGQTMTVTAQAGGLGGAQAEVQQSTLGDIEAWDLSTLAATVNDQIIAPFLAMNGIPGRAVMQVATDTGKELTNKTAFLVAVTQAGLEPTEAAIKVLSDASGIPLQRAGTRALGLHAFTSNGATSRADAILRRHGQPTNAQLDQIAQTGAADLAEAFTGRFSIVPRLIAASTSPADLEARLHAHFSSLPPARISSLIEDALTAYAATGSATA